MRNPLVDRYNHEKANGFKEELKKAQFNIPSTPNNKKLLKEAKDAIAYAQTDKALISLSELKNTEINKLVPLLSNRLVEYKRSSIAGVISSEDKTLNQINKDIIDLIDVCEAEIKQSAEWEDEIKTYLKKKYSTRLEQKMAGRHPINLKMIQSTEGTSEETAALFETFSDSEIQAHISSIFEKAHGRLLITGVPGAGKTSILLQLELKLLETQTEALPVVVNLATWKSEFITLDTWLKEIFPTELGVNKPLATKILEQERLILLFDGLDEVGKKHRKTCLEAIGRYGEKTDRDYVITSRISEYKQVMKDAPVNAQISVELLTLQQVKTELQRLEHTQPEAKRLLHILNKDVFLQKVIQIPFYFNTLQMMFAGGRTLSDWNFTGITQEERETEIIKGFLEYQLAYNPSKPYTAIQAQQYLSFFAYNLNQRQKVVFEMIDLQYNWWYQWAKWQLFIMNFLYSLLRSLFIGLFVGLLGSLIVGLSYGLLYGLLIGSLLGGLVGGLIIKELPIIETKGKTNWTWSKWGGYIKKNLFFNIVVYLVVSIVYSLIYGLIIGLIVGLMVCLVVGLIRSLQEGNYGVIQIQEPYQRFKVSAKVGYFSIWQHRHLLYLLNKKELLPYRFLDFLKDMTEQKILESDGATWRFRHKILQDYCARACIES